MHDELPVASPDPEQPWFASLAAKVTAVALLVGCLNFLGVAFVDQIPSNSWLLIPFLIGCASAQISIIAVGCGLLRGNGIKRISILLVVALFWLAAYLLGMKILDERVPMEVILAVSIISVVSIATYQLPIAIYAWISRKVLQFEWADKGTLENQFQIKHLLMATTVFAVLIAATKLIFDNVRFTGGAVPWWEVIFFFATFILIAAATLIPAIIIVFDEKRRFAAACVAALTVVVFGPMLALVGMSISFRGRGPFSDPGEFFEEIYPGTLMFILGSFVTTMLFLWLLKAAGVSLTHHRATGAVKSRR